MNLKKHVKKKIRKYQNFRKTNSKYIFLNNYRDEKNVCIILAGYKEYVWTAVFGRIAKYVPADVHVCIISSGLYSEKLKDIALQNKWSYLSTQKNNLCLAQNIAIKLFENVDGIFKLDEDMFVTRDFFASMFETYDYVSNCDRYAVGFVSALTPINGYGYIRLLEKIGKLDDYEKKFGRAYFTAGSENDEFLMNKQVPLFLNEIAEFQNIDLLSEKLHEEPFNYSICPIRFSIGAIYFKRVIWEKMGMFTVPYGGVGLGVDERDLCSFCVTTSRAIIVSENCAVGHLGYGTHMSEDVKKYFLSHRELFEINE